MTIRYLVLAHYNPAYFAELLAALERQGSLSAVGGADFGAEDGLILLNGDSYRQVVTPRAAKRIRREPWTLTPPQPFAAGWSTP